MEPEDYDRIVDLVHHLEPWARKYDVDSVSMLYYLSAVLGATLGDAVEEDQYKAVAAKAAANSVAFAKWLQTPHGGIVH